MHKKPSEFTTLATFCQIGKSLDLEDKFYSAFKVEKTGKKIVVVPKIVQEIVRPSVTKLLFPFKNINKQNILNHFTV